ncbi:MAG TPA: 30S ribosomal protein S1 [Firmicutes bacterium]|nr:30S ribosomal protein S1 [Bacillota bacterium]
MAETREERTQELTEKVTDAVVETTNAETGTAETPAEANGSQTTPEAPTPAERETGSAVTPDQQYAETFVTLEPGSIVKGRVVQINNDEVMVDVGYKTEGRIPLHELGLKAGQTPQDILAVGDDVHVYIVKIEDAEGNVLLSKRRADIRLVWDKLEQMYRESQTLEAKVTERVKGGLLVDVGVRGFLPASHVARNYIENLDKFVGETLRLKIIEIDKQRNNVVLSRKVVLEEEYLAAKEKVFSSLKEGMITEGVVKRITDFGAFVDIGSGVEGLLHVSEMAWSRVNHPADVVKEGQVIKVMVLNIDKEHERISLSLKETLPDPWDTVSNRYVVGEIVEGEVTRVVDFGAFVKLEDGIEGLVHISQMAEQHVTNPNEVVKPGDKVQVKIVSLDERARRIGLSIREALPKQPKKPRQEAAESGDYIDKTHDAPTFGDVFKDLSKLIEEKAENNAKNNGN